MRITDITSEIAAIEAEIVALPTGCAEERAVLDEIYGAEIGYLVAKPTDPRRALGEEV